MPATYGAVSDALSYIREYFKDEIDTVTDIGAGSGAATWACRELLSPSAINCLEYEDQMIRIGKALMEEDAKLKDITFWQKFDLLSDGTITHSDMIISSYVINELPSDKRAQAIEKMWDAAGKMMVIIEPGTKAGFSVISDIREQILNKGGHIIAPCPHGDTCRLPEDDWCHFTCRVQRSKLHKQIKDAAVPYEDEKYSFIAFSKEPVTPCNCRILRHPEINKGFIRLSVCTDEANEEITVTKKDKDLFKQARKAKQGDTLDL
jgi:ribosomal protein RSM22 (predicted rRNA methylase)